MSLDRRSLYYSRETPGPLARPGPKPLRVLRGSLRALGSVFLGFASAGSVRRLFAGSHPVAQDQPWQQFIAHRCDERQHALARPSRPLKDEPPEGVPG